MSEVLSGNSDISINSQESFGDKQDRIISELQTLLSPEEFKKFDDIRMDLHRLHIERVELKDKEANEIQASFYRILKGEADPTLEAEQDVNRHNYYQTQDKNLVNLLLQKSVLFKRIISNDIFRNYQQFFLEVENIQHRANDLNDQKIADLRKELVASLSNRKAIDEIRVKLKDLPKFLVANDNGRMENIAANLNDLPPAAANG